MVPLFSVRELPGEAGRARQSIEREVQTEISCQLCEFLLNHYLNSGFISNRQLKINSAAVTASPKVLACKALSSRLLWLFIWALDYEAHSAWSNVSNRRKEERISNDSTPFLSHPVVNESLDQASLGQVIPHPVGKMEMLW